MIAGVGSGLLQLAASERSFQRWLHRNTKIESLRAKSPAAASGFGGARNAVPQPFSAD
jgi:hypothetical protein